jgi:translation initiation factor 2 beta subunit (eIF-2beta)/eIF-5
MFVPEKYFDNGVKVCACDHRYKPIIDRDEDGIFVYCKACRKAGPSRPSKDKAIDAWNRGEKI